MNLSFQPGGFAPQTPQKNLRYFFFIFQKMGFWVIGIIRLHNLRKRMVPWFRARKMLQDGGLLLFIACLWTHFVMFLRFIRGWQMSVKNQSKFKAVSWNIVWNNKHIMKSKQIFFRKHLSLQIHTKRARARSGRALFVCPSLLRCFLKNICLLFIICLLFQTIF